MHDRREIFPSTDSHETASHAEVFGRKGFLIINSILPTASVDSMWTAAMENFHELNALMESNNLSLGIGIKEGYKEIVQRHSKRFEMTFGMTDEIFNTAINNSMILSTVSAILGSDFIVINRSLVISLPGAADQSWHSDGPHMSLTEDIPCHCLNVFIPLIDISVLNGPTSFRPESHFYTRDLPKLYMKAFVRKELKAVESPCLKKGSAIIFDYRYDHFFVEYLLMKFM